MFSGGYKREVLEMHGNCVKSYENKAKKLEKSGESLYKQRQEVVELIKSVEKLINSIANTPKEFSVRLGKISKEREQFRKTEEYAMELYKSSVKASKVTGAGALGGASFAAMAPTGAMWVATTYGVASTGTAISTLSGAAAANAALAWLGGGALTAGGAGMAGGGALLALSGPVGWGIAGVTAVGALVAKGSSDRKIIEKAESEISKIKKEMNKIEGSISLIDALFIESTKIKAVVDRDLGYAQGYAGKNYTTFSAEARKRLSVLVTDTESLSVLLNMTIG